VADGVEEDRGAVHRERLRGEDARADGLADERQRGVRVRLHEATAAKLDDVDRARERHAEPERRATGELRARQVVARVHHHLRVGTERLDLAHRAPQHALATAPVARVRMEEADGVRLELRAANVRRRQAEEDQHRGDEPVRREGHRPEGGDHRRGERTSEDDAAPYLKQQRQRRPRSSAARELAQKFAARARARQRRPVTRGFQQDFFLRAVQKERGACAISADAHAPIRERPALHHGSLLLPLRIHARRP
jgi:hypothetical protein